MIDQSDPVHRYLQRNSITADQAAESIADGIRAEEFLILPHPEVAEYFSMKSDDYDRFIRAMQRLRQKLTRDQEHHAA